MSKTQEKTVAFIGSGMMAEAMIKGLIEKKIFSPTKITCADPHQTKLQDLKKKYGIQMAASNVEAIENADFVVLSCKPQSFLDVSNELQGRFKPGQCVMSIVAGISSDVLMLKCKHTSVVRVMPNTPARIGQGISVWKASEDLSEEMIANVTQLLSALGKQIRVHKDDEVDMATALSGTGPAYVFLFMEALIDAGVHMGFSRQVSEQLVLQTVSGSVAYALEEPKHLAELRNQVTSPGGTSAAALYQMEKGGLRTVLSKSVWFAYQRAKELMKAWDSHS